MELKNPNLHKPMFDVAAAEAYFVATYEDVPDEISLEGRATVYAPLPGYRGPPPKNGFDESKLERHKLMDATKKKKDKILGIDGIPFLVYKKCSGLMNVHFWIMSRAWMKKEVPVCWQCIIVLLEKEDKLCEPSVQTYRFT